MPRDESIAEWSQAVSREEEGPVAAEPRLLANLYTSCNELYSSIISSLLIQTSVSPTILTSLQRSHDHLRLWANGYGVKEGRLDSLLYRSRRARRGTFRLLTSVCRTLIKRLLPFADDDHRPKLYSNAGEVGEALQRLELFIDRDAHDSDSDLSSEDSSDDDVDLADIAEDLQTDAECLLDHGYRFNEQTVGPAPTSLESAAVPEIPTKTDPLRMIFMDRIRTRYPSCKPELIELLGMAQYERIIRCQETRDRNIQARLTLPSGDEKLAHEATSTSLRDSGLGSSVPTASSYAETVISYAGGQGVSVHVPPLPEGANKGVPFECIGCEKMVVMKNNPTWKRHILADLQPYICLDNTCQQRTTPFLTKAQWEQHVISEHKDSIPWKNLKCPICLEDISNNASNASKHVAGHLEQIALTGLPANIDPEDEAESGRNALSNQSEASPTDTVEREKGLHQPGVQSSTTVDIDRNIPTNVQAKPKGSQAKATNRARRGTRRQLFTAHAATGR
ncbi:hypothetical protein PG984_006625 [Apiospora sp. TS-2023a]